MRGALLASLTLLVGGVALVAISVAEGGASVYLLVIVPVVTGSSPLFLLGVVLFVAGFLTLPFALTEEWGERIPPPTPSPPPASGGPSGGLGGVVLLGPVPIVFGSWKGISRRTRWMLAVVGAVVLSVAIVAFVWFRG